jgi:hypothetical protein
MSKMNESVFSKKFQDLRFSVENYLLIISPLSTLKIQLKIYEVLSKSFIEISKITKTLHSYTNFCIFLQEVLMGRKETTQM